MSRNYLEQLSLYLGAHTRRIDYFILRLLSTFHIRMRVMHVEAPIFFLNFLKTNNSSSDAIGRRDRRGGTRCRDRQWNRRDENGRREASPAESYEENEESR